MDVYQETTIKINFDRGMDITPIIVFQGVEIEDKAKSFNKNTHEIEEVLNHITEWENSGCDVFVQTQYMEKKYKLVHIYPPCFTTIGGQRYLMPGWTPVEDHISFDDVEHINPMASIKTLTYRAIGSRGDTYIITKRGNTLSCDCPGGRFRGSCKHSKKIQEELLITF